MAFLDTNTVKNPDGSLKFTVYRKKTHHPLIHKLGVVRTLYNRANDIVTDPDDREKEKDHIRTALHRCKYPDWAINKAIKPRKKKETQETEKETPREKRAPVCIPYVKGVSEEMRRTFGKYGVNSYFKPYNTLRQQLVRPKDKTKKENKKGVVFHIKCEDCDSDYIGETKRSLKERFLEHNRRSCTTSEVSKHIYEQNPGHTTTLENTKVLDTDSGKFNRGIRESIYIRTHTPTLNRDGGRHKLPQVWTNILRAHLLPKGGPTSNIH